MRRPQSGDRAQTSAVWNIVRTTTTADDFHTNFRPLAEVIHLLLISPPPLVHQLSCERILICGLLPDTSASLSPYLPVRDEWPARAYTVPGCIYAWNVLFPCIYTTRVRTPDIHFCPAKFSHLNFVMVAAGVVNKSCSSEK